MGIFASMKVVSCLIAAGLLCAPALAGNRELHQGFIFESRRNTALKDRLKGFPSEAYIYAEELSTDLDKYTSIERIESDARFFARENGFSPLTKAESLKKLTNFHLAMTDEEIMAMEDKFLAQIYVDVSGYKIPEGIIVGHVRVEVRRAGFLPQGQTTDVGVWHRISDYQCGPSRTNEAITKCLKDLFALLGKDWKDQQ